MQPEEHIARLLNSFIKLPFVSDAVPGRIMEEIISNVYGARVLNTYDYVDVVIDGSHGWQVKSTKDSTPLTWKRAKIEGKQSLIEESVRSSDGAAALGEAIINFCNQHAIESLHRYRLKKIYYSRCILFPGTKIKYFERLLCADASPYIFKPQDYRWEWSKSKNTTKKEQLSAFHGIDKTTGRKVWAWHGLGENQLHFSGEDLWWNDPANTLSVEVPFPRKSEKINFQSFVDYLLSISGKDLSIAAMSNGGTALPN